MYFESLLPADYEIMSNKHIIDKDKIVIEKKLKLKELPTANLNYQKIFINKKSNVVKKTNSKKAIKNKLLQLNIKYANSFFVNLTKEQKEKIKSLSKDKNLKHLVLHTYSEDSEIAVKRLENIYNLLSPKLRVNTIYKQDLCYEGNPCNTTSIKLIY